LRQACETIGFFYVANHGIPTPIFDGVFDTTRRYFDLPQAQRLTHRMDERFRRGFMPQGINQHPGYAPDLKESYEIGVDLPLTDPDVVAGLPLYGPNRWPAECPWLRQAAESYFAETLDLGKRLLRVFAVSLDMPADYFLQFCTKPMVQMRLFHYPPQPPITDDKAFGVAPHSDYGMITLLSQDPIGGLELKKRSGEWVGAPFIPGTLVINIGDLFQRWTNDVFLATPHRAINRSGGERYAIPFFCDSNIDWPVAAVPTTVGPDKPPKYPTTWYTDYMVWYQKRNYDAVYPQAAE